MSDNNRFDNDAYEDLLNAYAKEDSTKKSEAKEKDLHSVVETHTQNKKQFKINIENLNSEFHEKQKPQSVSEQRRRQGTYYHSEPTVRKERTVKEKPKKKIAPVKNKAQDGVVYDDEFGPIITRGHKSVRQPNHRAVGDEALLVNESPKTAKAIILKNGNPFTKTAAQANTRDFIKFVEQNKKAWIIVTVCLVCAIIISTFTISCMNDILAIHRDSENVVTVTIPAESDTSSIIDILSDNKLIKHKNFCKVFAKIMKYRDDNYLTGIYYVTQSMGVEKMLSSFKSSPVTGKTVSITFPEGFTVDQIVKKIDESEVCEASVMYKALEEVDFSNEFSFIKEAKNKEQRYEQLEGYMYPDTYEFYKGENASSIIRKFLKNFEQKWTDEYSEKASSLGMSVDDIIRLASIIEKEAANADQAPLVSSVLHNRLSNSGIYPTLQCDSTKEYIDEYISKRVEDKNKIDAYTARYNTYNCEGLPVGAICNPGKVSIEAALNPKKTNYFFFAHDVNKKIYLAKTDSEHRANYVEILRVNQAAKKSAG